VNVALITHDAGFLHDAGYGHPERPARMEAARAGVKESGLDVVTREAPEATRAELGRVHDPGYIDGIERLCRSGGGRLDPDTRAGSDSWEAALRSAGAGLEAVRTLQSEQAEVGFVVMRPPGHHALAARAMGFCLFNNIAVTARALEAQGERVVILDWDVHHGNGTQDTFYADPDVLYVSFHESPFYPGTGSIAETGTGPAVGTTVNFPFPAGTGGAPYREALSTVVGGLVDRYQPDWLLVSAGYDAHFADPLAGMRLEAADFGAMANLLRGWVPAYRTIFFLEGGYDLDAIRTSVAATLRGVSGMAFPEPATYAADRRAEQAIALAAAQMPH
jgi:acetoin utilization deacetylase AcuC-like enzyme